MLTQDMRTGIYTRFIITTLMLLMFGAGEMWAQGVTVTIADGITNGTISQSSISGREVTLTVTPTTSKYYTRASDIIVNPLAGSGQANAPRRVPGVANQIVGKMYKHGAERKAENEIYTIENPNSADYVFEVPAGYNDVYVTAMFYLKSESEITSSTSSVTYNAGGTYILLDDIDASVLDNLYSGSQTTAFAGTFKGVAKADGTFPVIRNLDHPLFDTATGATICNIMLEDVGISQDGAVGSICSTANGDTRIYNVGILSGEIKSTGATTESPKSKNCCGGLVGLLDGTARVINCFSFAKITGGNRVGGIVGYNNADASKAGSINTMVMNCMFYGDITAGTKVSPVYGGNNIINLKHDSDRSLDGLNTFNFYAYEELKAEGIAAANILYNCTLGVEDRFLTRFEIHRQLLNSNKKLAAKYASTSTTTVNPNDMAKWVLETADRTITNPKPYPILKAQGKYPSIINYDVNHAPSLILENGKPADADRKKGGKLGTLSVSISSVGSGAPTGASLTRSSLTLVRTDMDEDHFNFNYDKVQLPYYNDVGTGNYTNNKVVTGWKITSISGGTPGTYNTSDSWGGYNFADRMCTNKDLNRIFSQGAYFDIPYGVTSITIEPYWGKAAYVADEYMDVVYDKSYSAQSITQLGRQYGTNGTSVTINGSSQKVYTSISNALGQLSGVSDPSVYDYAVVLVGNLHQGGGINNGNKPFTLMSIDLDKDNEPDYSYIYHGNNRHATCPIRFDFLNIPGTAQAQKPWESTKLCNVAVFDAKAWFEITNTCLIFFSQFEYENNTSKTSDKSPIILLGGVYDQFVSTKVSAPISTTYLHVGGNAWFKEFSNGTHSDGKLATKHIPISVTGGDYEGFYLTGTYNANAATYTDDAECYISGGHFKEAAGSGQEQINGNVRWQIYNADIEKFFGGGIKAPVTITGNVTVDIYNSYVTTYCGGPKFGDMQAGKKVTTNATGCVFTNFFGAGYGGTSLKKQKYFDHTSYNFTALLNKYSDDYSKYFDNATDELKSTDNKNSYGFKGPGVATDFDYEFFVWTGGDVGARFFVNFASFSLAQCNDVESVLSNCTIKSNFYGGGRLGKVVGDITSVLDGCTVKGNVFGAGFSANYDPVEVRTSGFVNGKAPSYSKQSGMFEQAKKLDSVPYSWTHVESYPSNGGDGFVGTQVKTTEILTNENLGSVNGNVSLTIKGNSVIGIEGNNTVGNVYGGGDESQVKGAANKITVTLQGNTRVYGSVFGGGNSGHVDGSTTVNIEQ